MGFDVGFIEAQLPALAEGALITFVVSALAILLSLVGGLTGGAFRAYRIPVLSRLIEVYVELIRNTPFAVQLFFLYFGLPNLGITMSGIVCGTLALTLFGTAYAIENFRAAFEAVPRDPLNAASALGMNGLDVFLLIRLPIAVRTAVRPVANTAILILKDSSVLYLISVHELTYSAVNIIAVTFRALEMFTVLGVVYLGAVIAMAAAASFYERRLRLSVTV
jgi:polar amino acid transport system permease protein